MPTLKLAVAREERPKLCMLRAGSELQCNRKKANKFNTIFSIFMHV